MLSPASASTTRQRRTSRPSSRRRTACDPFYGCIQYQANQTVDDYTSNAVGFDGGLGLTYKPSRFSGQKLYVEARYVFMDNSARPAIRHQRLLPAELEPDLLRPSHLRPALLVDLFPNPTRSPPCAGHATRSYVVLDKLARCDSASLGLATRQENSSKRSLQIDTSKADAKTHHKEVWVLLRNSSMP